MTDRKMATIRRIDSILPIKGADAIEVAKVGGWKVVVKKGEFNAGDLAVYFELDSWIPTAIAPFLTKVGHFPSVFGGVEGERLRTVKLRGQLSQGLLLPFTAVMAIMIGAGPGARFDDYTDMDVSDLLGIAKYEAPINAQLAGMAAGAFPSWGRKTDAERIQNLPAAFEEFKKLDFEVTVKLDGSSMSAGISVDDVYVVCSRNLSLKTDQVGNSFVDMAAKCDLERKLRSLNRPLLISGELMGPGIQQNQEKLTTPQFFVFNIWDPIAYAYIPAAERIAICTALGIQHAPVLHTTVTLSALNISTIDDMLKYADGPSLTNVPREGLVFKSTDGTVMFKAISNKWLLKNE